MPGRATRVVGAHTPLAKPRLAAAPADDMRFLLLVLQHGIGSELLDMCFKGNGP